MLTSNLGLIGCALVLEAAVVEAQLVSRRAALTPRAVQVRK